MTNPTDRLDADEISAEDCEPVRAAVVMQRLASQLERMAAQPRPGGAAHITAPGFSHGAEGKRKSSTETFAVTQVSASRS